ncbi:MAG: PEP-CTERM sorting domain-containing protein [Chthonomonas sp.]|nr:PEP-CTERM sorting domain-containing protein [Chthonomonas sp.]
MKLNTRTIALAAVIGVAGVANAQFRFFLAYGDADLATLQKKNYGGISNPAAAVGVEIPTNAPLKVWKAGDGKTFKVSVMVVRTGGNADALYSGGSVLAMYDRAPVANSTSTLANESTFLDKKLAFGGTTIASSVTGFGSFATYNGDGTDVDDDGDGAADTNAISALSRVLRGQFTGNTSTPRGVGLSVQYQMNPTGKNYKVGSTAVKLFDLTFKSNLAAFEQYNGLSLFVAGAGAPNGGSSTFIGGANDANSVGTSLTVQAVPEPGTAAAIVAGLAALGLRRRSK